MHQRRGMLYLEDVVRETLNRSIVLELALKGLAAECDINEPREDWLTALWLHSSEVSDGLNRVVKMADEIAAASGSAA